MQLHSSALAALALAAAAPAASAQLERAQPDQLISQPFVTTHAGVAVEIEGDQAAVTSGGGNFIFNDAFVSFYERAADGTWGLVANVGPQTAGRYFGAAVSISGSRALVGDPGRAGQAGRVNEVFGIGTWSLASGFIVPPGSAADDRFGSSLDLDGVRALIGAPGANGAAGTAHVFERDPSTAVWNHVAQLVPSSVNAGDWIGTSVLWSNGRALVGASQSDLAAPNSGAVFVFEETAPGTWTEVQALFGTGAAGALFGTRMDADGDRLAVTAPGVPAATGNLQGTTFVYERDALTGQYVQVDAVQVPVATDIGFNPTLYGVALEGDDLVVAHAATIGAVHVFERTSSGTWRPSVRLETEFLAAGGAGPFTSYGFGAALALDEGRLLVGATGEQPAGLLGLSGGAHEFGIGTLYHGKRRVLQPGPDTQPHYLRATDARAGDFYYFVGTVSGTSPGTLDVPSGITVPINVDAYTLFLLNTGGAGLGSPLGVLDANGEAQSSYTMPGGLPPSFVGLVVHHCYLIIDSTTFAFDQVSNPVPALIQ